MGAPRKWKGQDTSGRLFRLPGAVRRDAAVDAWFGARDGQFGAMAREWFDEMRACGPDVREQLHDGHPTACVGDAAFGYVNVFAEHVNVGFFEGASLDDPAGLLVGTGRFMRHVKLVAGRRVDRVALRALITRAYASLRGRLREGAAGDSGQRAQSPTRSG